MGKHLNRRKFIKDSTCAAMGTTAIWNSIANLGAFNGLAGSDSTVTDAGDYKALVCVMLSGGADTFNILMPTGMGEGGDVGYLHYEGIRTNLAIPQNEILGFNNANLVGHQNFTSAYNSYGVHPAMADMKAVFDAGDLAFISNIGTLVEPLASNDEYRNSNKKRPLGIGSHSDQRMQWQTSVPQSRNALGVAGRMADLIRVQNENQAISMNISLAGKNRFQSGQDVVEYAISDNLNPSNIGFRGVNTGNRSFLTQVRNEAVDDIVAHTYQNLLQQTMGNLTKQSVDSFQQFREALETAPPINTPFNTDNGFARDLAAIAKVISIRQSLGVKRQIFFLDAGGWDMHDNLLGSLAQRLPLINEGLKQFYDALGELGMKDNVTTFTASDFARTITSNGQGSDHAWGGNHMVMGGAVKGNTIYGAYPSMNIYENPMNTSFRGSFVPAVSIDEFYAELALWYGVSPVDLCYVLPNLGNFYSYSAGNYPIGFMDFAGTSICTTDQPYNCLSY